MNRFFLKTQNLSFTLSSLAKQVDFKQEVVAAFSTFVTMAYILVLNPLILANAGIPLSISFFGTCIATASACFLLGFWAKTPLIVGPSMAINGYFVMHVVQNFAGDWSEALGAVFLSGFMLCVAAYYNLPSKIKIAIPKVIMQSTIAGISLLILSVVIESADLMDYTSMHFNIDNVVGFGLTLIIVLINNKYKIIGGSLLAIIIGSLVFDFFWPEHIILKKAFNVAGFNIMLSFAGFFNTFFNALLLAFLVLFDSTSTIMVLSENYNLNKSSDFNQQKSKILMTNGFSTMVGGALGVSNMGVYFESATGLEAKAVSGWCPIIVGIGFLCSLLLAPYLVFIPNAVPTAVLFLIALKILAVVKHIDWYDINIAIPCLLVIVVIAVFKAIADGVGLGILVYIILNFRLKTINKETYILMFSMCGYWLAKLVLLLN